LALDQLQAVRERDDQEELPEEYVEEKTVPPTPNIEPAARMGRSIKPSNILCKVLSHDPESMLSHVVALSEVLYKVYLNHAYPSTFEVTPTTLELTQLHTAVEEAGPTS
jgi:hypothetical protein